MLSLVYVMLILETTAHALLNSTVKCFYNLFLRLNFIRSQLSEQWPKRSLRNCFFYIWAYSLEIHKIVSSYCFCLCEPHAVPSGILSTRTLVVDRTSRVGFLLFDGHKPISFWVDLTHSPIGGFHTEAICCPGSELIPGECLCSSELNKDMICLTD